MSCTRLFELAGSPESVDTVLSSLSRDEQVCAVAAFLKDFEANVVRREDELNLASAVRNFINTRQLLEPLKARRDSDSRLGIMDDAIKNQKQEDKRLEKQKYLEAIHRVESWERFPDDLPETMRTTQRGAPKAFRKETLGQFVTLARLVSFSEALGFFEQYIEDRGSTSHVLVDAIARFSAQATVGSPQQLSHVNGNNGLPQKRRWVGSNPPRGGRSGTRQRPKRVFPCSNRIPQMPSASSTTCPTAQHVQSTVSIDPTARQVLRDTDEGCQEPMSSTASGTLDARTKTALGSEGHTNSVRRRSSESSDSVELGRAARTGCDEEMSEISFDHNIWSGTPSRSQEMHATGTHMVVPTREDDHSRGIEPAHHGTNNTVQGGPTSPGYGTDHLRRLAGNHAADVTSNERSLFGNALWLPSFASHDNELDSFSRTDGLPEKLDPETATRIVRLLSEHEHDLSSAVDKVQAHWMRWQDELKRIEEYELATVDARLKLSNAMKEHDMSHNLYTNERTSASGDQVGEFCQSYMAKRHILEDARMAAQDARAAIDIQRPVLQSLLAQWGTSSMDDCFAKYVACQQTRTRGLEMLKRMPQATS